MWVSWFGMFLYLRPDVYTQFTDIWYSFLLSVIFLFSATGIEYLVYKRGRKSNQR
jgi:hypothetical protein